MYCAICGELKKEGREELLTFSVTAYAQVVSILKIANDSAGKVMVADSAVCVCIKCLQGIN